MSERPLSRRGRTLKLYLADGTPPGVIAAELGVSPVRAAVASRTALPGKFLRFAAGTAFDSPSGAAGVFYGGNVSGNRCWRHATTGQTYGDWRKRRIGDGCGA